MILSTDEIHTLRLTDGSLREAIRRVRSEIREDEQDDELASIAKSLIECESLSEAETVVSEISPDWSSEAVEIEASIAERLWRSGDHIKARRLLVRTLRHSYQCDDWGWIEAAAMAVVARTAAFMQEVQISRAILLEAATVASAEMDRADGERSLDACGVMGELAIDLQALGFQEDALRTARRIASQDKRTKVIERLRIQI